MALTAAAGLQADSFTGLARRFASRLAGTCLGVLAAAGGATSFGAALDARR